MYFDAVIDRNTDVVLFDGWPREVVEWLIATADNWEMQKNAQIRVGWTSEMKSIDGYLREYDASQEIHGV